MDKENSRLHFSATRYDDTPLKSANFPDLPSEVGIRTAQIFTLRLSTGARFKTLGRMVAYA